MNAMHVTCGLLSTLFPALAPADPPRVVEVVPDHGDVGVDPSLGEIRVVFDQGMQGGHSICGGGPTFPRITGKARWESPRVLVVPVAVEPGHRYQMSINCASFRNFRSPAGEACEIVPVAFTTAPADGSPVALAALTPDQNEMALDALMTAIAERYSYRDRVVKDWEAAIAPHREEIVRARTRAGFARATARAFAAAQDPHVALLVNGEAFPTYRAETVPNVNGAILEHIVPGLRRESPVVATGRFDDGFVYIQINGWPSDAAPLAAAHGFLTRHADAPGVIIDVRLNGGGDEVSARRFAARFCREPAVYSRNRTRDPSAREGWTRTFDRVVGPDDATDPATGAIARPCRAPTVVLIGPSCMSSNESFVLMMKLGAAATLVGARTFGSSGNPRAVELGNGVSVRLPTWEDSLPDGSVLEGRGIEPDTAVEFLGKGHDEVLDAALSRLRSGTE